MHRWKYLKNYVNEVGVYCSLHLFKVFRRSWPFKCTLQGSYHCKASWRIQESKQKLYGLKLTFITLHWSHLPRKNATLLVNASIIATRTTIRKRNQDICAWYFLINLLYGLLRVEPCFGCGTNTDRNKEAVRSLNQGEINLVLKLKAQLIPLILRVTLDEVFCKKVFSEIKQHSQENTCAKSPF